MATINSIDGNQLLSTTNSVTFAGLTLTSALTVPNGGTGATTFTAHSLLLGQTAGAITALGAATHGQLVIGSTGIDPVLATITAGANVSVTNGAGSITIATTGVMPFAWVEVTGTSASMSANTGYAANNAGLVTLTLPTTAAIGDQIIVTGKGAGGWTIIQNSGQTINYGSSTTTVTTGSLSSTLQYDTVTLRCITANTVFNVVSGVGNITVV